MSVARGVPCRMSEVRSYYPLLAEIEFASCESGSRAVCSDQMQGSRPALSRF